jgi:hypothetical protein
MRASSITLLLATGLWAVAACGSGGGDPSGHAGPLENGDYQKPFTSYEPPPTTPTPSDYETPPSIYESGSPSTPGAPNGSGELCKTFCDVADANDCQSDPDSEGDIVGMPHDECVDSCTFSTTDTACTTELNALFDCIFDNMAFSCEELRDLEHGGLDDLDDGVAEACDGSIQPLVNCLDNQEPPDEGNNGSCTLPDQCSGCRDACQRCRCENLGDDGPCTDCRN